MKKRLLAMLLGIVMAISCATPAIPVDFGSEADSAAGIYWNDEIVTEISFPSNKTADISVEEADDCENYQWQIKVPGSDIWVNIYEEDDTTLSLSSALIYNMLDDDIAYIRCAMTVADEEIYTEPVAVSTTDAEHEEIEIPEYVPAPAPVNEAEDFEEEEIEEIEGEDEEPADEEEPAEEPVMMFFAAPRAVADIPFYTIRIDYLFEDGTLAAQSWEGTFMEGTSYSLDVTSPKVNGYVANVERIEEEYDPIEEDHTFTVTYSPIFVKYAIKHQKQNVNDDDYTEVTADRREYEDKYANDPVGAGHENTYEGFKAQDYDATTAIAADGSTELNIYYDRLYYLMSFDLDGGYGVDPIYARYGSEIPKDLSPKKPGYAFVGWDDSIPGTMPAENTSFKANWQAGSQVDVNLVFWYENANDNGYTYVGDATSTATYADGAKVTPSQFKDVSFTGRDNLHFDFNTSKNTAVALNADGSTIVNIYFTRKTYKMIFFNCMQSGHESDKSSCYPSTRADALECVKNLSDRVATRLDPSGAWVWDISIYTRKWQQNVRPDWEKGIADRSNTRRWRPYAVNGADGQVIYDGTLNVSTMNVMPDADVVFRFLSTGSTECTMNYWVTPVPGESTAEKTTKEADGVTYVLRNKVVTMMGGITENEEYVDIEGFKKVYTWAQLINKGFKTDTSTTATAHFFYKRNSYDVAYISNGSTVKTAKVEFEGAINGTTNNKNYVPPYPADWEDGAYTFGGWYLSENCGEDTKVNWETEKMPVGGISVYAKWNPVTHTVTVKTGEDGSAEGAYTTLHGTVVTNPPADPTREGYSFISWFYKDENGVEYPFTFEMPINEDIVLYPKWKQDAIVSGTLHYELEDGTVIADSLSIQALVGESKVYNAKTSEELFPLYQEGYFPAEVNHSISFDIDSSKNTHTFIYDSRDYVGYTVKYLEAGTNKQLAEDKVTTSTKASVLENFKPIAGYIPDLYRKTLILCLDESQNVLTFWYTKDSEYAPVLRGHYLQNAENDSYTTYQEILDGYGLIGQTYSESPMTEFVGVNINGFTLNEEKSLQSGTLTAAGLELKLYYDRNLYPYEFRFEDENGRELAASVTGTAKFEAIIQQEALAIPGYSLISDNEIIDGTTKKEIQIAIQNGETASSNVKVFKYKAEFTDLTIVKEGADTDLDQNQSFLFEIIGDPIDEMRADINMTVAICGNGSVTIRHLPVGTYTVTELTGWSWRYDVVNEEGAAVIDPVVTVSLIDPIDGEVTVSFKNKRTETKWLDGNDWCQNIFGETAAIVTPAGKTPVETTALTEEDDEE